LPTPPYSTRRHRPNPPPAGAPVQHGCRRRGAGGTAAAAGASVRQRRRLQRTHPRLHRGASSWLAGEVRTLAYRSVGDASA